MKLRYLFLLLFLIALVATFFFLKSCADANFEAAQQKQSKFDSLRLVPGLNLLARNNERHYIQFSNLFANDMPHALKLMDTVMLTLGYTNTRAIYEFSVGKPVEMAETEIRQVLEANYKDPYLRIEVANHKTPDLKSIRVNFRIRR